MFNPGDQVYKGSEFFIVEQSIAPAAILVRPHTGRKVMALWEDLRHATERDLQRHI